MHSLTLALLSNHGTEAGQQAIKHIAATCTQQSPTVGYISSAEDHDRYFYEYTKAMYQRVNLSVKEYVDFESGYSNDLLNTVLSHPIVHLSGGNTFQFLQGVQRRGAYQKLIDYAQNGGKFIGLSAGAMLLTPDIELSEEIGDEASFAVENTQGLQLVDMQFLPHVQASDRASLAQLSATSQFPTILCDDHSAVLIIEGKKQIIGQPFVAHKGQLSELIA